MKIDAENGRSSDEETKDGDEKEDEEEEKEFERFEAASTTMWRCLRGGFRSEGGPWKGGERTRRAEGEF